MKLFKILYNNYKMYRGIKVYRIQFLKDTEYCKAGELGGWVDSSSIIDNESYILEDSIVIHSNISKSLVRESIITFSIVENSKLCKVVEVLESNIYNSDIKTSNIKSSNIYNSKTFNVSINTSGVNESELRNGFISSSYIFNSNIESNVNSSTAKYVNSLCTLDNATIKGKESQVITINNISDYLVFKNWWSSGRFFTYVPKIKKWFVGCFEGNHKELINKAYDDSEDSVNHYKAIVEFVKSQGL